MTVPWKWVAFWLFYRRAANIIVQLSIWRTNENFYYLKFFFRFGCEIQEPETAYLKRYVAAEPHVTGHRQMVQLEQVGNALEALQEFVHLVEAATQFHQRRGREGAERAQRQITAVNIVQVRHQQKQIGRLLNRQEARARYIDTWKRQLKTKSMIVRIQTKLID